MIYLVGAKGMIGRNLQKIFLESDLNFCTIASNEWEGVFENITKEDYVLFMRAVSSPIFVQQNMAISYNVNVHKTEIALERILRIGAKVIFFSSDVVYGNTTDAPLSEQAASNPHGEYARQKATIEKQFQMWPNFLTLRLSNIVGEDSRLRNLLKSNKVTEIYHPVIRCPIRVEHLALVIESLLKSNEAWQAASGILNVGGQTPMSNLELAKIEAKIMHLPQPIGIARSAIDLLARPEKVIISSKLAEDIANIDFVI